jgi:hypothetical protein
MGYFKEFSDVLISNKAVIKHRRIRWYKTLIIFLFSAFIVFIPFFVGKFGTTGEELLLNFEGFHEDFYELIQSQECEFKQGYFLCEQETSVIEGDSYKIFLLPDAEIKETENVIVFYSDSFLISKTSTNYQYGLFTFGDISFEELRENFTTYQIDPKEWSGVFLRNMALSNLSFELVIIYLGLMVQYAIYILVVSMFMMFINTKQSGQRWKYGEVLTMLVLAMLSPALLMAFLSLFMAGTASIIFPIIFVVRIVFLYGTMMNTPIESLRSELVP